MIRGICRAACLGLALMSAMASAAQADAVDGLVATLRANPRLARGPFAVVFRLTARPGKDSEIEQTMRSIVQPTRAEAGCLAFSLHRDAEDPPTFFLYERWRIVDDLEAHLRTPYIQNAFRVYATSATDGGHATFGVPLDDR